MGLFRFDLWFLVFLFLILGHATYNMLYDLWSKIDKRCERYGAHRRETLHHGFEFLHYTLVTILCALVIGVWLCYLKGWIVVCLILANSLFFFFYDWLFKHIGLGEPSYTVVWCPLMITGGDYRRYHKIFTFLG